ncbi:MAG: hypothetical protein SFV23_16250 [Planctomycetaceae bacterium]|nr:hypothetical protein [Planctomycetaceae bacterium]
MRRVETSEEKGALQQRYQQAEAAAVARGAKDAFEKFAATVAHSRAVMACTIDKLLPVANGHTELYPAYNDWLKLRFTFDPERGQTDWHDLRGHAEWTLFKIKGEPVVHYAALSADGLSAPGYGECHITLKTHMVAHRATTFEGNSAVWLRDRNYQLPPGFRAIWADRHKHACAKLGDQLRPRTSESEFPGILLKPGPTALDHEFIEVHIYGPLTVCTFESVKLATATAAQGAAKRSRKRLGQTLPDAIQKLFAQAKIPVQPK